MDEVVKAFSTLSVAAVSDAMDRLGLGGQCLGIQSIQPGNRMAGRAFTIKYIPCGVVKGTVGDYIDDVPPGGSIARCGAIFSPRWRTSAAWPARWCTGFAVT